MFFFLFISHFSELVMFGGKTLCTNSDDNEFQLITNLSSSHHNYPEKDCMQQAGKVTTMSTYMLAGCTRIDPGIFF